MSKITYDRVRNVEIAEIVGLVGGMLGVSAEIKLAEYSAAFDRMKAETKAKYTDIFAAMRAAYSTKLIERTDAEALWTTFSTRTNGIQPPVIIYLIGLLVAGLIAVVEPLFLAPVMDGLGIANRTAQFGTAFVLVVFPAVLFEVAKYGFLNIAETDSKISAKKRYMVVGGTIALSALVLTYTGVLGFWRAKELIHAGQNDTDGMGTFLASHPTVTTLLFTILTIGLPLALMFLSDACLNSLSFAHKWLRARRSKTRLVAEHELVEKRLAETETQLAESLNSLDEQAEEFRQCYLHAYARGTAIGAWRQSWFIPVVRTVAVFFTALVGFIIANLIIDSLIGTSFFEGARLPIIAFATAATTGFFAVRFYRSWNTPTDREIWAQQAIPFNNVRRVSVRSSGADADPLLLEGAHPRILSGAVRTNGRKAELS